MQKDIEKSKNPPVGKCNTTSTMYISSTISAPDMKFIIKAIARLLNNKIEEDKVIKFPQNTIY